MWKEPKSPKVRFAAHIARADRQLFSRIRANRNLDNRESKGTQLRLEKSQMKSLSQNLIQTVRRTLTPAGSWLPRTTDLSNSNYSGISDGIFWIQIQAKTMNTSSSMDSYPWTLSSKKPIKETSTVYSPFKEVMQWLYCPSLY